MGIPSYYKKLADTVSGLIHYGEGEAISWLFMDFNCLIYHCLHREDTPVYPGEEHKKEWEAELIECVIQYCLRVIKQVNPQEGVYMAIDGVVPMAKMRQQRLRRFKSVWESGVSNDKWNTNAITPGTDFMKALHEGLQRMIRTHKTKGSWLLSTSDEPGEGEHKIMARWRESHVQHNKPIAVYGLDADLVVLSLLGRTQCKLKNVWLFRERMEEGKIAYDEEGKEQFEWFSIHALSDWLVTVKGIRILDYCFTMSVLGNDFLPSSLGLKMRDDGHAVLMEMLQDNHSHVLIDETTCEISFEGVEHFFTRLSRTETRQIEQAIHKKRMISSNLKKSSQPSMNLGQHNWPLEHIEEECLLSPMTHKLEDRWYVRYQKQFFPGQTTESVTEVYLYGLQWIWSYYTGRMENVCFNWYYPFSLPPLWSWVVSMIQTGVYAFPTTIQLKAHDIRPVEQLALVLPLESWSLIPSHAVKERKFPLLAPQFFPSSFGFESVGKRYFWECEAMISLPSMVELKAIIA